MDPAIISSLPKSELLVSWDSLIHPSIHINEKEVQEYTWNHLEQQNSRNYRYAEIVIDLTHDFPWEDNIHTLLNGIGSALEKGYTDLKVHGNLVVLLSAREWPLWRKIHKQFEENESVRPFWKGLVFTLVKEKQIPVEIIEYCRKRKLSLLTDIRRVAITEELTEHLSQWSSRILINPDILKRQKELDILYKNRCPLIILAEEITDKNHWLLDPEIIQEYLHKGLCLNFGGTINLSNTKKEEYLLSMNSFLNLTKEDMFILLRNGIEASLLEEDEKFLLYKELSAYLEPDEELLENI